MRVIVLYDSLHGNTKLVAQAIGAAIGDEAMVLSVTDTAPSDLELIDLLIIGAPTHGSLPSKPMYEYIKELSDAVITGLKRLFSILENQ